MALKPFDQLSRSQQYRRRKGLTVSVYEDSRGRHSNHVRGVLHYRWNDGLTRSSHGYLKVQVGRFHPMADPNGYAYLHDLVVVAAIERQLGPDEVVHHENEQTWDNRLENLKVITRSEHAQHHNAGRERNDQGQFAAVQAPAGRTWDEYPEAGDVR